MHGWLNFWFAYFPYICLSVMVAGICFRYLNAPESWNSHSTELMEKKLLRVGSPLFHAGVLMAVGGHAAGFTPAVAPRPLSARNRAMWMK